MKNKKFILVFYGPSCGGKSSVIESLMSRHENIFRASQDKIKFLVSKYYWEKHSETVHKLLIKLAKGAISEGFSLIVEGNIQAMKNGSKDFKLIAKKNKMNFFEFNIEAPFEVTKERFGERIKKAKLEGTKVSNKNLKRFKEIYNFYKSNKSEKVHTFDSSKSSPKKIAGKIEEIIFSTKHL